MGWKLREILAGADSLDGVRSVAHATKNDTINWMLTAASSAESSGLVFDLKDDAHANPMELFSEFNLLRWQATKRFLAANTIKNPGDMWAFLRDHSGSRLEFFYYRKHDSKH